MLNGRPFHPESQRPADRLTRRRPATTRGVLALALAAVLTEPNAAQTAPPNLLPALVGTWAFELGARRGIRVIRPIYGNEAVEYRETFDGADLEGRGVITYDPAKRRYLSMGLHNRPGTAGASVGEPRDDGTTVIFRSLLPDDEQLPTESRLVVESSDRFRYELRQRVDGEWRLVWTARFRRLAGRAPTGATLGRYPTVVATQDLGAAHDGTKLGRMTVWRPVLPAPAQGGERRPSVLAAGSIASRGGEFAALAEALASHGIVTAEVEPDGSAPAPAFDVTAVRRGVDRLRRARTLLNRDPGIDATRSGVVVWSFGGVPGALTGCRESRAIVSLDSALRYRYGTDLLHTQGFDASACSADLMAIDAGVANTVPTDDAFVAAWPASRVERRVGHGLAHGDLVERADRAPSDAATRANYGRVLDDVVAYFVDRLKP